MHSQLAYWAGILMIAFGLSFIIFIEFFAIFKKEFVTVYTPGWRGIAPSSMLVGMILSAIVSTLATLCAVWF